MNNYIKNLFNICDKYIEEGKLAFANMILAKINNLPNISNDEIYITKYNYLKNKINEKYYFKSISPDIRYKYDSFLEDIENYLIRNNLNDALNSCSIALFLTEASIFKYYMAKIYYRLENYYECKCYLKQYLEEGASMFYDALELLNMINSKKLKYQYN